MSIVTDSPYARVGATLVNQGYAAIPCKPKSKIPGVYRGGEWFNETDWTRFCERLPTATETEIWAKWPDAGVCIALGFNDVVAVDIDTDDPAIVAAIEAALGELSWVQKAGRKGRTLFYRAGPAVVSAAFNITGERVLDLLCKGKQTVVPPTIHKDTGRPYRWLSGTLEHVAPENLPVLPDEVAARLGAALAPFGYEAPVERPQPVGEGDGAWDDVKAMALANLDAWVPHLGIDAKRRGKNGWRGIARWRNGDGMNVSFHPTGIKDYGDGDRGMSAIDVVMDAMGLDFADAVDWLKDKLGIKDLPRPNLVFRKAGEAEPVGEMEAEEVELIDSAEIMRMVIGAREEALALADSDDAEDVAWLARMRQEISAFSEGVTLARELFPADVFERHFIAAAVVAVGDKLDAARELNAPVEATHIVGWLESAIQALESEPPEVVGEQWAPKQKQAQSAPRLPVITGKDLLGRTDIAKPWFLVDGMIQGKKVNLVSGQDGAGKSFLMLQLAIAVATGGYWLGRKMEKGPVIFYTAEEELADLKVRIMAIVASLGYAEPPDLSDLHLIPMGGEDTAVLGEPVNGGKIQATPLWKVFVGNIETIGPRVVIIDPLNETFDGDELKRVQARQFVGLMRPVAAKRNLAIIVTSHPSKTGIEERTGNSGSTGWPALMRGGANLEIVWDESDKTVDTGKRLLSPRKVTGGERTAKLDLVKGPGGVLLIDVPGGAAGGPLNLSAGLLKIEEDKKEFMDVIEKKAAIGVFLSASPKSPKGYAPKVVTESGKGAKGRDRLTRIKANERIMEDLLSEGRIISERYGPPSDEKWRLKVVSRTIPGVSETENHEGEDEG